MRKYGVLASAQVAIGAAAIFARYALTGAQPIAVAALRLAIASAVLLAIAAVAPRQARRPSIPQDDTGAPQDDTGVPLFICAGVALAVHFAAWITSLEYTSVAVSTLLVTTTPIWTALYDSFVLKRALSLLALTAFVAGAVGLVLVVGFNATRAPVSGHELLGGALAIAGAIAMAAYLLLVREVRSAFGTRAIVTRTYTWAAIALVLASVAARQAPPAATHLASWGGILAMALVSQLLGHTALNASLRWFSPSAVAFSTLLEPLFAGILAFAIFGEGLTPSALAGGALVLLAIATFLREEALA